MRGVNGDDAQIEKALRELTAAWAATEDGWRDVAREGFSRHHLQPLEARLRASVRSIRQLESLLEEAIRQCS